MATTTAHPVAPDRRVPRAVMIALVAGFFACAAYVNLSFAVTHPAGYRYFPPFRPGVNANDNRHLGGEYFRIAQALRSGRGFADPFGDETGPTAWMPPVYPVLLAGFLHVCGGDRDAVMAVIVVIQMAVLVWTGILVVAVARQTAPHMNPWAVAGVFAGAVLCNFQRWFQFTHDCWLLLLTINLLLLGCCRGPLATRRMAVAWGVLGGFGALVSPVIGFTWAAVTAVVTLRQRRWKQALLAGACAAVVLSPWVVRNYLVFGRLIFIKSNAPYELYQSQCLQPDGLIQRTTFLRHPGRVRTREGGEYRSLGETAYLDRKREQFREAVAADPGGFLDRLAARFVGALFWYVPFDREGESLRPWALWLCRLTHPLPSLAIVLLAITATWRPLDARQTAVVGIYLVYLLPYIAMSYYERYTTPLIVLKVLLVVWALDRMLGLRWREREGIC
jgi:hypothetical protein